MSLKSYIRSYLRRQVSTIPSIYLPVARWRNPLLAASKETDLILEGYPRSGNSFAEAALITPQDRTLNLAHHCHAPAQVLYGVHQNIPCLVLIREPIGAVTSFYIKMSGKITLEWALNEYLIFYRALSDVMDQCVVADFKTVTQDFGTVIETLNRRYQLNLNNWPNKIVARSEVMNTVERLNQERRGTSSTGYGSKASAAELTQREIEKKQIRQQIARRNYQHLVSECQSFYKEISRSAI